MSTSENIKQRRTSRLGQWKRWAAGAAVGATLVIAGMVTAAPAQAVSLPGRCDLNAGVWTCLP